MKRIFLCMIAAAALLEAKGVTVKIAIKGGGLAKPVEIAGDQVGAFHVWSGPGVFVNGVEEKEGFIVEWQKGVVADRPSGLQHYEIEFYSGCRVGCLSSDPPPALSYVVSYAYDPVTSQSFVYLPGRNDEAFKLNKMLHGHGYEGNWLRATAAWDKFARPILAKAGQ